MRQQFWDTRSDAVPWISCTYDVKAVLIEGCSVRVVAASTGRSKSAVHTARSLSTGQEEGGAGLWLGGATKNRYRFPIPRTTVAPQSTLTPCTRDTKKPLEPTTPCAWGGVGGHFVGDWR